MLSKSLKQQIICRWIEFRREPSAFFWVMFMPVLWMLALGFAFSDPKPETYGIAWSPDTYQAMPDALRKTMSQHKQLRIRKADQEQLERYLKRGDISVIVEWQNNQLSFLFDPNNPEARARETCFMI